MITFFLSPPIDSEIVGLFCGDNSPGTLLSSTNMMLVRFVTDESVTSAGFLADYVAEGRQASYSYMQHLQTLVIHAKHGFQN